MARNRRVTVLPVARRPTQAWAVTSTSPSARVAVLAAATKDFPVDSLVER